MERIVNLEVFEPRLHEPDLAHYYENFDAAEWLGDTRNVVLRQGGSFGAFEYNLPHVYTAHYMFREHRGRAAIDLSNDMLSEMTNRYEAKLIRGLIEIDNKASRWITRQLGFTSHGIIETKVGPCEIFMKNLSPRRKEE